MKGNFDAAAGSCIITVINTVIVLLLIKSIGEEKIG